MRGWRASQRKGECERARGRRREWPRDNSQNWKPSPLPLRRGLSFWKRKATHTGAGSQGEKHENESSFCEKCFIRDETSGRQNLDYKDSSAVYLRCLFTRIRSRAAKSPPPRYSFNRWQMRPGYELEFDESTCDGQRGHAVHADVCDRSRDGLVDVDEAVLDVSLAEEVAVEVQAVGASGDASLRDVSQGGGRRQRGDVGAQAGEQPHPVARLEDAGRVLEQHRHTAVQHVAREDAASVHVEDELVAPHRLRTCKTSPRLNKQMKLNYAQMLLPSETNTYQRIYHFRTRPDVISDTGENARALCGPTERRHKTPVPLRLALHGTVGAYLEIGGSGVVAQNWHEGRDGGSQHEGVVASQPEQLALERHLSAPRPDSLEFAVYHLALQTSYSRGPTAREITSISSPIGCSRVTMAAVAGIEAHVAEHSKRESPLPASKPVQVAPRDADIRTILVADVVFFHVTRAEMHASRDQLCQPTEVSMEQCRNEIAGDVGNHRENPPISGIARHDSHLQKSGENRPRIRKIENYLLIERDYLISAQRRTCQIDATKSNGKHSTVWHSISITQGPFPNHSRVNPQQSALASSVVEASHFASH
ncbi:hypothetical protein PR048_014981 [Dryococelus australis]|uniref:Uncharacterized protein n=1 Tax=Dryococelus australis TaxID=614101 RepID=A0ABQ9HFP8_9NEOP|nr:hypothetical protein PR048_014981 [Dryococelus australis]